MSEIYQFYGERIETPLSIFHNTDLYDGSQIGLMNAKSGNSIWIDVVHPAYRDAAYIWRVVDVDYSPEDTLMSRFYAYDLDGHILGNAVFGVTWASVPSQIRGGFRYPPIDGRRYYVPDAGFVTHATGGYKVQVLDLLNPSESLAFGLHKMDKAHHGVIVRFRLFELKPGYPNDWQPDDR